MGVQNGNLVSILVLMDESFRQNEIDIVVCEDEKAIKLTASTWQEFPSLF